MLSCRAACSLLKVRATQHVFTVARALSVESKEPDHPKSDFRWRSAQRGDSSSKLGSNLHSSSVRRASPTPRHVDRSAIQKSQALTARIGELGRQGRWQGVLRALETAENNGQKLNSNNFSAAIAALTRSKQPERALQLVPLMQDRDIQPCVYTYTALIDACSKGGQWQSALALLSEMQQQGITPNVRSYTAAIDACSKSGQWQKALELLGQMRQRNVKPNVRSYTAAIDACSKGGQWQRALELLSEMQLQDIKPNEKTYTAAIDACSKGGQWQQAVGLLREALAKGVTPTAEMFTATIDGYGSKGLWQQAVALLREMVVLFNVKPSVDSYNAVINACSKGKQWQQAVELLREMQQQGLMPDVITYTAVIDAHSNSGQWQKAVAFLREMVQSNVKPNIQSYNAAIDACSGSGQWQQAVSLLREMQQQQHIVPDSRTYNRVINACQNGGNWQLAVDLLSELKAAGLKANDISYKCVIDALHAANEHDKAEQMYIEMLQQGLTVSHWSTAIKGMLDFHNFTEGMTAAAMRIVLRAMILHNATAARNIVSSSSASYVHPIANDLHIITGHAMNREGKDSSIVQETVIDTLTQRSIECSVNARNKGMVTVKNSALQACAARVAVTQH
jgi:pentatricopeptide repeat protein